MEKPRRRAAGRPAGPPNPLRDEPAAPEVSPAVDSPAVDSQTTAEHPDVGEPSKDDTRTPQHRRRQRATRLPNNDQPTADRTPSGTARDTQHARHHPGRDQAPPAQPTAGQSTLPAPYRDDRRRAESSMERSLRALVSMRTTALTPTVAMRAREVASPSAADLAAAEIDLVIVRRHYVPPAPLATAKKSSAESNAADGRASDRRGGPDERGPSAESRRGGRRQPRGDG